MTPTAGRKSDTLLNESLGEPWRYVCPSCGSSTLYRRNGDRISGSEPEGKCYCSGCNSGLNYVYDKRRGHEVQV